MYINKHKITVLRVTLYYGRLYLYVKSVAKEAVSQFTLPLLDKCLTKDTEIILDQTGQSYVETEGTDY